MPFISIALSAPAVALGVLVCALTSTEFRSIRATISQARRATFGFPGGRPALVMFWFVMIVGSAAALGLYRSGSLGLVGAVVISTLSVWLMQDREGIPVQRLLWAGIIGICVVGGSARFDSLSTDAVMSAQIATGPALLVLPLPETAASTVLFLGGLLATVMWVHSGPSNLSGPNLALAAMLRWAQTMLAGFAVASVAWGPGLGAVAFAPIGRRTLILTAGSVGAYLVTAAAASFAGRFVTGRPSAAFTAGVGGVCLMCAVVLVIL